jgi:hypothetical protein
MNQFVPILQGLFVPLLSHARLCTDEKSGLGTAGRRFKSCCPDQFRPLFRERLRLRGQDLHFVDGIG